MENKNKNKKKNNNQSKIIKLDVGGQLFQTTLATVNSCKNSLAYFLSYTAKEAERQGWDEVYINRSGKHFHSILNYLRDGSVPLPSDPCLLRELLAEAQYYKIEGLIHLCQQALDQINQETKPISSVPMVSFTEEMQHLIATTSKPVISLTINRTLYKCKNKGDSSRFYENIIKNIELFEKFSLKLRDAAVFVRDFTEQSQYGCVWSFHYEGELRDVLYTDNDDGTCIKFPESEINDAVMRSILNCNSDSKPPVHNMTCLPKPEENVSSPPHLCEINYPALNQNLTVDKNTVKEFGVKYNECKDPFSKFSLLCENHELIKGIVSFLME